GLKASRKLKPRALSLYVGNGQREAVEAIGVFYLCLPSGLEIVLNNCHYAPSFTRGVISVSRLYEDGFINRFVNNTIQVSRNNMVYFSAIPKDGIFEIDLSNSYTNESSIYAVSNKRAKLDLDSALLWHCRLGHISKKRIKKLQHDGLLDSTDLKDHDIAHRTPPYTSQHNGVSERRNRTLLDMVRSMMSQTTLSKSFWDYALETVARILNMVPTKKVEKTPYENSKRESIPMQEKLKLSKSQGASTPAELKRMQNVPYASVVGSIMNTKDMFLVYGGDLKREFRVSCYTDVGYLTDVDDLKSQTGYVFVLNGGVVDWKSDKQSIFATSSAEAEYIAAFDASKEAVWVRKFISGLGVVPAIEESISMYCDNTGAIVIANESGITKGARHFRAKVHYIL
nr:hypothetical protein [Tanacetum cinerariifolium]